MRKGDYEAAFSAARPFIDAPDPQVRSDANRMCALSSSRLGRWSEAAVYWEGLFDCERIAHNALQVAASKVMAGQLSEGEEWMRKTTAMSHGAGQLFHFHTSYITALKSSGYVPAAMPYLQAVKEVYESLHSTDPTTLTMRGVPFFESFLAQSEAIVDASMDPAQAAAWYASMAPHVDENGQAALHALLERRATGGCRSGEDRSFMDT